jgi:hypothetical protein
MKVRLILLLSVCLAAVSAVRAQPAEPPPGAMRAPEQLDQLLGPIALYPDALVALILPAATAPSDIVLASRFLAAGGLPESIGNHSWDESVKSLAHYPEVLKWMDDNLEWTQELGEAFIAQPADVMKAVQRLRARAKAAGTLTDTPQQQLVMEGDAICIVPAQPDVIYVPRYDPEIVYVQRPVYYSEPFLTFGLGFAVGSWLTYDCDWGQRVIWVGRRSNGWRPPVLFTRPRYVSDPDWRHWKPSPRSRIARPEFHRPRVDVVRPRPYAEISPRPSWPRAGSMPDRGDRADRIGRDGRMEPRDDLRHGPPNVPPISAPAAAGTPAGVNRNPVPSVSGPPPTPGVRPARQGNESNSEVRRGFVDRRVGGEVRRESSPTPAPAPPASAATPATPASPPVMRERVRDPSGPGTPPAGRERGRDQPPGASPAFVPHAAPPAVAPPHVVPVAPQPPVSQPVRDANADPRRRDQDKNQN